jgi:hypothetical protein
MTAITKLTALAETLGAKRSELAAELDEARAILEAEPTPPYDEEAARRRGAVALAQDAADGGSRLAEVKAAINAERQAIERAQAAEIKAQDAARKTVAKREADIVELDVQLGEVDRLIRGEIAKAGRVFLEQSEADFRSAVAALIDAAARRTAALALANDDAEHESARSVGRFALSLPTMGLSFHDIEGAHHVGSAELRVDKEASGHLATAAYNAMKAQILGAS